MTMKMVVTGKMQGLRPTRSPGRRVQRAVARSPPSSTLARPPNSAVNWQSISQCQACTTSLFWGPLSLLVHLGLPGLPEERPTQGHEPTNIREGWAQLQAPHDHLHPQPEAWEPARPAFLPPTSKQLLLQALFPTCLT